MEKALITGSTGFVGSHLIEFLLDKGIEVHGTKRHRSSTKNVEHVYDQVKWHELDVTDSHSTLECVRKSDPDYIFHLAAQSHVPTSWNQPVETLNVNAGGTVNLLEAVREHSPEAFVQIAGSSEEYGLVRENEIPVREDNPLRPMSPYGVSKATADMLGIQYHNSYGLNVVVTRGFNHTGPRRGKGFVCSEWSKRIAEIEKKGEGKLTVGNLEAMRDFTDVRDIVRAYWLSVRECEAGERYNIGSGKGRKIRKILETLLDYTDAELNVEQNPEKMRPSDVPLLECDYSKFHEETGWEPEIKFEKTLKDLLNYWRDQLNL